MPLFIAQASVETEIIIIHYSDSHVGQYDYTDSLGRTSQERYEILVSAVNDQTFDFAVDTGDLIDGSQGANQTVLDIIGGILDTTNYTAYYAMGNHDWVRTLGRAYWLSDIGEDYIYYFDSGDFRFLFVAPNEWVGDGHEFVVFNETDKGLIRDAVDTDKTVLMFGHAPFGVWTDSDFVEDVAEEITFFGFGHRHQFSMPTTNSCIATNVPSIRVGSPIDQHDYLSFNRYTVTDSSIQIETIDAETLEVLMSGIYYYGESESSGSSESSLSMELIAIVVAILAIIGFILKHILGKRENE